MGEAAIEVKVVPSVATVEGLRSSLGDNEDPIILRTGDRGLFKRCRRLWGWTSHMKQGRVMRENADYLWFGTGIHYALEDFHGLNLYGHPTTAYLAYVKASEKANILPGTWQEHQSLGMALMSYYADYWLSVRSPLDTFEVDGIPQVEVNGAIDMGIDARTGKRVLYGFTLDRVVIDNYGRLWIQEYKTAKVIKNFHLDVDEQITAYPVPIDTEVLTRQGWKLHNQLIIGEDVLGYNHATESLEWTPLVDIHYPGLQSTVTLSNKSFEFVCTPEHSWAQVNTSNKWPDLPGKFELKPIKAGQQHHYVVMSAPYKSGTSAITPDEAAVIAWLLTDGNYINSNQTICQSRLKYAVQVQDLLNRFPDCYSRIQDKDGCNIWHLRLPFWRSLWGKAGLDLDLNGWEQFLLGLSEEALKSFCAVAMMAEGDENGNFYQNKGVKTDLFRMAFFLSGKFPTKGWSSGKGEGGFPNQGICEAFALGIPHKWVKTITSTPNEGKQEVFCTQTGLGTWVMRQKGQITITGNCWAAWKLYGVQVAGVVYQQFRKNIPNLPKVLANGQVSTDLRQQTTAAMYGKLLTDMYGSVEAAPANNVNAYNHFRMQEDEDKDKFIVRTYIERNEHQLNSFEQRVYLELEDMLNPDLPLYPYPKDTCDYMCPLQAACVAMEDGSDWQQILSAYSTPTKSALTQREKEQSRWRALLPEPSEVVMPIAGLQYNKLLEQLSRQLEDHQVSPEESLAEELGLKL